jgi:hypothetical protein
MEWPDWWEWELEFSSHCLKRMQERGFNEAELRALLADAEELVEQIHGTFVVVSMQVDKRWEIIVAPDLEKRRIVVISAYSLS